MQHSEVRKHLSTIERIVAMSRVGAVLMSEFDEARLLHLIADTARDLTGAAFAAFTLRPINEEGQPPVPSEGTLFHRRIWFESADPWTSEKGCSTWKATCFQSAIACRS